jgi:hypothetical protein
MLGVPAFQLTDLITKQGSEFVWRLYENSPPLMTTALIHSILYLLPFHDFLTPIAVLSGPTRPNGKPGRIGVFVADGRKPTPR